MGRTESKLTMNENETNKSISKPTFDDAQDPAAVLASTSLARTLTISDQHATILLTTNNKKSDEDDCKNNKALLKLTLVPFHKKELAVMLPPRALDEKDEDTIQATSEVILRAKEEEKEHSSKVLNFLSQLDWRMTSESGAEYSFHEAFLKKSSTKADDPTTFTSTATVDAEPALKKPKLMILPQETTNKEDVVKPSCSNVMMFKAELIYPASERQLSRAMPSPGVSLVTETPELYNAVTKPFIDGIVASGSLSWLQNIVQVKKEKERLLWNAPGWILNIDTKWRTHPDALTVPRSDWFKHESTVDLYCLGILKGDGVASLRDLTGDHLPVLREMLDQGPTVIEQVYGIPKDQLRIFVHYQPQFYHFHVHFTRLENDIGCQVEKAHLLSDIIQDLEANPHCFQTSKTIVYKLSLKEKLYKLVTAHHNQGKEKTIDINSDPKK